MMAETHSETTNDLVSRMLADVDALRGADGNGDVPDVLAVQLRRMANGLSGMSDGGDIDEDYQLTVSAVIELVTELKRQYR